MPIGRSITSAVKLMFVTILPAACAGTESARQPAPPNHSTDASGPGARDRIEQIIADMSAPSEALVIDPQFPWQYRPQVTMHAPRGSAIPAWWRGNRPSRTNAAVAWFTAFEAEGNKAINTRVQVRNLRLFALSNARRRWDRIDTRPCPEVALWAYPFRYAGGAGSVRPEADGGVSMTPVYPRFYHGWGHARPIAADDIGATFTAMEFRLTLDDVNRIDDRARARYVVDVGADYYPDMNLRWSLDYAPGIGNGRMLLASTDWRTATLLVPNTDHGITLEQLRDNPPPLSIPSGDGRADPSPSACATDGPF